MGSDSPKPHISTKVIIASLLTLLAWQAEIILIVSHIIGGWARRPALVGHLALTAAACCLTIYSCKYGRREFTKIAHLRGRFPISLFQAVWVIAIACLWGVFIAWVTGVFELA